MHSILVPHERSGGLLEFEIRDWGKRGGRKIPGSLAGFPLSRIQSRVLQDSTWGRTAFNLA